MNPKALGDSVEEDTMRAAKLAAVSKKIMAAVDVAELVVLGAALVYLVVVGVRGGVAWDQPWGTGNPLGPDAGWLVFLSAICALVTLLFSLLARLRHRRSTKRWDFASTAMCLVFGFALIASKAGTSNEDRAGYALFACLGIVLDAYIFLWLGARSEGGNDASGEA